MELFYSSDIRDGIVRLDPEESGHCVRVLRHRAGDEISVIDGTGPLYRCRLTGDDPRGAVAEIVDTLPAFGAHPYRLTLAVCPTKNIDRYEWFVEKATEIGVDAIAPVIGDHSERKVLRTDRLERLVLSAAKQSLKGSIPRILPPQSVREFIAGSGPEALRLIAYCDESLPQRCGIVEALADCRGRDIAVLIGPEGDFSPAEVAAALEAGFIPVHLGPSRLRTETAALTAVQAVYLSCI